MALKDGTGLREVREMMCKHGDTVNVELLTVARCSHTGRDFRRVWPVDRCIAKIVESLDRGGVRMLGSCCGHGKGDGQILLEDGRILRIEKWAVYGAG